MENMFVSAHQNFAMTGCKKYDCADFILTLAIVHHAKW